jgi:hypothetical protein
MSAFQNIGLAAVAGSPNTFGVRLMKIKQNNYSLYIPAH